LIWRRECEDMITRIDRYTVVIRSSEMRTTRMVRRSFPRAQLLLALTEGKILWTVQVRDFEDKENGFIVSSHKAAYSYTLALQSTS
jgi:hypothetical protein